MTTWYIEYTYPYINFKYHSILQGCVTVKAQGQRLTIEEINNIKRERARESCQTLPKYIADELNWTHVVFTLVLQIDNAE
jgi:hypothetical protein